MGFGEGEEVEVKSFKPGYRGAWFRCRIEKVGKTSTQPPRTKYQVKYLDYQDEGLHWMYEYQIQPLTMGTQQKTLEHMMRPVPPIVLMDRDFQVGDQVEWQFDHCWWRCAIIEILDDHHYKVALPDPPYGEGSIYTAEKTLLRPALVWTKENEWHSCHQEHEPHLGVIIIDDSAKTMPKWHTLRQLVRGVSYK